MKFVIAGGTGSLGRRLADDLARRGHDVVILTRHRVDALQHRQVRWDGISVGDWAGELDGAVVVNLAGALVDRRPSAANIELLRRSRVEPTRALVEAARRCAVPPHLWLQMSTLAIYGDAGPAVIDEQHPPADEPPQMAGVARAWEAAVVDAPAERLVILRTGIVFDRATPAYDRLARLTKLGLGGRIGAGTQWVSWIHIEDFLRAIRFVIGSPDLDGVVHVTSPEPVQNASMMAALRRSLRRPWSPPTPTWLVRVGAWLLRTDPALATTGRRCVPAQLLDRGFEFRHPSFEDALAHVVAEPCRSEFWLDGQPRR